MTSLNSPLLHIPTKKRDEVDFAASFRTYIQTVYQEDADKYSAEIGHLNRLRQDTRGAGKDLTGRDILYRYYGQLELLDLRFPIDEKNVKVLFTWYDAFSNKTVSQYSIAYEKACTIFNIAATCSSIAALQNRFEASGLKMAFNYFQAAAGLFTYINDNFLHAPSTDLSRDSIKTLVDLVLAQAQECFLEKVVMEKKRGILVAKLAAQASHQYTLTLEGLGNASVKGQFEKAWADLVRVKAKHFQAISMYHKALQLETENKYGEIVGHLQLAEIYAREAQKLATSFQSSFPSFTTTSLSTTSSDSGSAGQSTTVAAALVEITKLNVNVISDHKTRATKDNDLIYHENVPNPDTIPAVDKLAAVKPITFAEVCAGGAADIPKIIGPDIFAKLVPLSVHESNSVYSEEKDKLVRAEKDRAISADGELQASLISMDLIPILDRLKRFVKGAGAVDDSARLPDEVRAWNQDVRTAEESGGTRTEELGSILDTLKQKVREVLDDIGRLLDKEQSACEAMRVKYMDQWTQEPSGRLTSTLRSDIRRHRESFDQAASTDTALLQRVSESRREIGDLRRNSDELESIFAEIVLLNNTTTSGKQAAPVVSLLDDDGSASAGVSNGKGLNTLGEQMVVEKLDQLLSRLRGLKMERAEIIEDLKQKTQQDDIASLLLLNKNKESQIFISEIAKFKPIQARLTANLQAHQQMLQELGNEYGRLRESSSGLKTLEARDRRKVKLVAEWREYYMRWVETREGLNRGIQFYSGLSELVDGLKDSVVTFVNKRDSERTQLVKRIEDDQAEKGQQALREQLRRLSTQPSSPTYHPQQGPPPPQPQPQTPQAPHYPPQSQQPQQQQQSYIPAQQPSYVPSQPPSMPPIQASYAPAAPPPPSPYASSPSYNSNSSQPPYSSMPPARPPSTPPNPYVYNNPSNLHGVPANPSPSPGNFAPSLATATPQHVPSFAQSQYPTSGYTNFAPANLAAPNPGGAYTNAPPTNSGNSYQPSQQQLPTGVPPPQPFVNQNVYSQQQQQPSSYLPQPNSNYAPPPTSVQQQPNSSYGGPNSNTNPPSGSAGYSNPYPRYNTPQYGAGEQQYARPPINANINSGAPPASQAGYSQPGGWSSQQPPASSVYRPQPPTQQPSWQGGYQQPGYSAPAAGGGGSQQQQAPYTNTGNGAYQPASTIQASTNGAAPMGTSYSNPAYPANGYGYAGQSQQPPQQQQQYGYGQQQQQPAYNQPQQQQPVYGQQQPPINQGPPGWRPPSLMD
ncbi:hypothetical protein SmJEL517_g03330 [Synchytrium microbalum]|uniref:BRO domain-containing protein 1 n=1 Tax=Synchytrium microbalum TaxID=1806994 RepID=A0A507C355_9FUNG|nr:uncharacterized protein SmJEL517_g03330 [Synchytrium microbalum]TPX33881.1 hypothetical protein SmJEL517_g03330 [Synchytrium microbalum]